MAGIYLHVPFCKQRCTYCDFYTQVLPNLIPDFVTSIQKEMHIRKDYLKGETIETIYFGGGTPSLLSVDQFQMIFQTIFCLFKVEDHAEITFEANPDDLSSDFLGQIRKLPFNRISIGIQAFDNNLLKSINRRHSAEQAIEAVKRCKTAGLENISIDLIYGLPAQNMENWKAQLKAAFELGVKHISVYGLTYEQNTKLWKQRERGEIIPTNDEEMIAMYEALLTGMSDHGYEAYEISNFCKPGSRSKHNSAYWKMKPYLGLGPSAHSFDGDSRQWNISNIRKYIQAVDESSPFYEVELLSERDKYNDYIMVSLRISDGVSEIYLKDNFDKKYVDYFIKSVCIFIDQSDIIHENSCFRLTRKGIHISNYIISELMFVDD
ncbi:MAG: radical SAM family heme chaperone HemW [Paludibacter sp.]|nr:radical SAM family heme chaperone HemW [Paludibacter sp.]